MDKLTNQNVYEWLGFSKNAPVTRERLYGALGSGDKQDITSTITRRALCNDCPDPICTVLGRDCKFFQKIVEELRKGV